MRATILACLLLVTASPAAPQASRVPLRKGDRVYLRVPLHEFHHVPTKFRLWLAEAAVRDSVVVVNGDPNWQSSGFLYPNAVRVSDIRIDARNHLWRARFARGREPDLTLTVPLSDTAAVIPRLVADSADSAAVVAESYAAIGRRIFPGTADSLPAPILSRLLGVIDSLLGGDSLRLVDFQGVPYVEIPAPSPEGVYVYSNLPPPRQRGAVMNTLVIPIVCHLGRADTSLPRSLRFSIPVRVTVYDYVPTGIVVADLLLGTRATTSRGKPAYQDVTFYFDGELASRFAAGAISSQELVDQSVAILKGSYVGVDLSQ